MKYKVGDKVKVRADLKTHTEYGMENKPKNTNTATPDMVSFAGETVTITGISGGQYSIDRGFVLYKWTDEMFEGLAKEEDEKIIITHEGRKTIAKMYKGDKVVNEAMTRCSPEDTFEFEVGAKLAFERLMDTKTECKYKVGQKYRFLGFMFAPKGIIEITKINGDRVSYKILEGLNDDPGGDFQIGSIFCDRLELIEENPDYYNGKVVCVEKDKDYAYTVGKIYEFKDGKVVIDNGSTLPTDFSISDLSRWNDDPVYHCKFIALKE